MNLSEIINKINTETDTAVKSALENSYDNELIRYFSKLAINHADIKQITEENS